MLRVELIRGSLLRPIAVAMVIVTAACSSPAANETPPASLPTASTTPLAAADDEFVSKRYAFRLRVTPDWSANDAQVPWDGKKLRGLSSPAFADFSDPSAARSFVVGEAPVAKGMQLATWRAAMVRAAPSECKDSPLTAKTTLGGEPALTWTTTCTYGGGISKIAALHGRHGYMTIWEVGAATQTAADRRVFDSIRRSFSYTS